MYVLTKVPYSQFITFTPKVQLKQLLPPPLLAFLLLICNLGNRSKNTFYTYCHNDVVVTELRLHYVNASFRVLYLFSSTNIVVMQCTEFALFQLRYICIFNTVILGKVFVLRIRIKYRL